MAHGTDENLRARRQIQEGLFSLMGEERFVTLEKQGFGTLLQRLVDGYAESLLGTMPAASPNRYLLYLASGAMCNTIAAWLREGAAEPPLVMAEVCARALSDGVIPELRNV